MPKVSELARKRLESLISGDKRVVVRMMFGQPAGFVNGNLCLGTFGAELFVRLNGSDFGTVSRIKGVHPFEPMPGRPMKHYAVLPPALLGKTAEARGWVQRSIEYVLTLPPK